MSRMRFIVLVAVAMQTWSSLVSNPLQATNILVGAVAGGPLCCSLDGTTVTSSVVVQVTNVSPEDENELIQSVFGFDYDDCTINTFTPQCGTALGAPIDCPVPNLIVRNKTSARNCPIAANSFMTATVGSQSKAEFSICFQPCIGSLCF